MFSTMSREAAIGHCIAEIKKVDSNLFGFDTAGQAFRAFVNHVDFRDRWDFQTEADKDLAAMVEAYKVQFWINV